MTIPFVDMKAQYDAIQAEIHEAMSAVLRDAAFIGGPYLEAFESGFREYCGTRHAVGVSNGTDAIRLALVACGVGPGDEVITVPNTFIATTEAITMTGAKVRFADVEPDTATMDPAALEAGITARTRAVVPVHLYGQPADMAPILAIAHRHGLKVVGDAAQAHGALYRDRRIGTLGDAAAFSFYPGKNLGAYGDAGAVVTDDPAIARKVSMLRDHGRTKKYEHEFEGFNCRLDGLQAAVLSVKLRHLDAWTRLRRRHAARYDQLLADVPGVELINQREGSQSVYHLYVIRTTRRTELKSHLERAGIATGIHYPIPLHRQRAYSHLGLSDGTYPVAERHCREALSLPMYPELTERQVEAVAGAVSGGLRSVGTITVPHN